MIGLVAKIALEGATFAFDKLYTYAIPPEMQGKVLKGMRVLVPFGRGNLKKQGIDRLDYLILTHSDIDHIGSADVIMTKFDIGTIFMSDFEKETKTYKNLLKLIEENEIRYLSPAVGNVYAFGSASFQILAPNDAYDKPNNTSIAFLLTHGENTFLFTGDAEKEAELITVKSLPISSKEKNC